MIPQGNTSTYALLPMRDIIGYYMGLESKTSKSVNNVANDKEDEDKDNNLQEDNINFSPQLKK